MSEIYESLKGFTDLPIVAAALVLGIFSLTKKSSREKASLFFMIALSAAIGTGIHIIDTGKTVHDIVWAVLYLLLFESVRRFTLLFTGFFGEKEYKETAVSRVAEAVCYIGAVATMTALGKYDMLFLVAFSAFSMVRVVSAAVKARHIPRKVWAVLLLIPPILVLQAFSAYIPYSVVAEHIIICALLFAVYSIE